LIFFTFCYFLLLFLLLVTFVNYFFTVQGSLFVTFCYFFTACNFHELFFIVEKGKGNCFIIFIHCSGGRGVPRFSFFKNLLLLKGRGGTSFFFFFLLHLTCGRSRGSGLVFFSKLVFHC
jgi:hypothetical protein